MLRDALQSAAIRLVGRRPTAFFGATSQFELELTDLVSEVAADIAKYHDWQSLINIETITGDGETSAFNLPSDYDRMLIDTELADLSSWFWNYGAFTNMNSFLYHERLGFNPQPGGWILYGNRLHFSPAPSENQTATFPYISKNWVVVSGGTTKAEFDSDEDQFVMPERLLTLGLVWRWRENKKLDASGDQEAFIKALDEEAAKDKGARIYRRNSRRFFNRARLAWPGTLGPATYPF